MKIILRNGIERDCHRDIGELLIAAGLAVEAVPEPAKQPKTTWGVWRSAHTGEAVLTAKCSTCGDGLNAMGPNAWKQVFLHCRVRETVPDYVAAQYRQLLADPNKPAPRPRDDASAAMRLLNQQIFDAPGAGETHYVKGDAKF